MDTFQSLTSSISQITMYDIKSMYNQAKNVVLNVTEMEAKVREATNDEPWGASSTLMTEIAQGTFNFQHFNEIMPCIYARFMEKEARQWRQIYKALQLLEYLIKHGSERVVDDARSHVSTIKMLRNFHYIDDKGKDEGLNVRNRAKELVELLSDVDKIRGERRKAKANKHKYTGTGNDGFGGGMSFSDGGSRYGGFGSESLGYGGGEREYSGYSGRSEYGGGSSSGFRDDNRRGGFEEYDAGDDEDVPSSTRVSNARTSTRTSTTASVTTKVKETKPAPAPAPEVDLLGGFGDDDTLSGAGTSSATFATNKALPAVAPLSAGTAVSLDDDDFADFQAAPTSPAATAPAAVPAAAPKMNLMDMLATAPAQPSNMPQSPPAYAARANTGGSMGMGMGMNAGMTSPTAGGGMGMGAGMFGHRPSMSGSFGASAMPQQQNQSLFGAPAHPVAAPMTMTPSKPTSTPTANPSAPASKAGAFDDLWSMSMGGGAAKPGAGANANQNKSIKDLEREKANAGLWGGAAKPAGANMGGFGSFGGMGGNSGTTGASSSGGADDLLL